MVIAERKSKSVVVYNNPLSICQTGNGLSWIVQLYADILTFVTLAIQYNAIFIEEG